MKIINESGETVLVIDDETFEITSSEDSDLEAIWNDWLENGITTIGAPPVAEPLIDDTMEDGERIIALSPENKSVIFHELIHLGFRLVD